jgi:hypothetical protein
MKGLGVSGMQETWVSDENSSPWIAGVIDGACDDERELAIKDAVLLDQMVADEASPEIGGRLLDTGAFLYEKFAAVPRQWRFRFDKRVHCRDLSV